MVETMSYDETAEPQRREDADPALDLNELAVSGRPPVWMRVATFAAVIIAGTLGATVGGSFARLSCTGSCQPQISGGIFLGAIAAATGTAIVVRIVLRGSDAWDLR